MRQTLLFTPSKKSVGCMKEIHNGFNPWHNKFVPENPWECRFRSVVIPIFCNLLVEQIPRLLISGLRLNELIKTAV